MGKVRHLSLRSLEERNALVEQWAKLPAFVVNRLQHISIVRRLDKDDAIQVGSLGLMRAAELWDPTKNIKFVTYAYWAIRNSVVREAKKAAKARKRFRPFSAVTALDWENSHALGLETSDNDIDIAEDIKSECGKLPPRCQEIVVRTVMRGETLRMVGDEVGLCRERVRQLRDEALEWLRRRLDYTLD